MSTSESQTSEQKAEGSEPLDDATHPCERVFGTCQAGATCPYKDAPRGACVAFLKGKCRFGAKCHEPHVLGHQGKYVAALHPCLRIYGSCRYGDQCEYANMSSDTCVKFLKGRCTFGDRCNEQHPGGGHLGFMGGMGMSGMGMGMGWPQMQQQMQMQGLGMMPFGAMSPYAAQSFGGGQEGSGILRGGKRGRDGETPIGLKRHQADQAQFMMNPNYYQQTAGGQMHPCIRIFGSCRDGAWCKYAMMPIGACLQYLKGSCKFGDACHEPHLQMPGQEHRNKGPGAKHPCERIYGFCQDGERCRFIDFPAESCLMFLKGKCKFGDNCRELHTRGLTDASTDSSSADNQSGEQ